MPRESSRAALAAEVQRFESELHRLAIELVRAVLLKQLERRFEPKSARPTSTRQPRRRATRRTGNTPLTTAPPPSVPPITVAPVPMADTHADVLPPGVDAEQMTTIDSGDTTGLGLVEQSEQRARTAGVARRWTRETVIDALGAWLLSGEPTEAAFIKRHGPKGLVAAATKVFGRFDAALNAANLAIAGRVDATRAKARQAHREHVPTMRELARQQQQRRRAAAVTL